MPSVATRPMRVALRREGECQDKQSRKGTAHKILPNYACSSESVSPAVTKQRGQVNPDAGYQDQPLAMKGLFDLRIILA